MEMLNYILSVLGYVVSIAAIGAATVFIIVLIYKMTRD